MLTCPRATGLEIFSGLPFEQDGNMDNIDTTLKLFQHYCISKMNVIYERFKFLSTNQKDNELATAYAALRKHVIWKTSLLTNCYLTN